MIMINKLSGGAAIILCSLFSAQAVVAQTPSEHHARIRAAMEAGDLKRALSELRILREANTTLFTDNNYDYLQARLSEMNGDTGQANSTYESVVARKSVLAQYALWHLAQSARSIGDLVLERERLRHLLAFDGASLLRVGVLLRLGESFFESADYDNAVAILEQLIATKNVATARKAAVLVGQSYLRKGKQTEARRVFAKLVMEMPDASRPDDFALAAVRALDSLDEQTSQAKATNDLQLSEAEHLLRASVYQFNRDFLGARSHYLAIIEHSPQSSSAPNALYQIGRGLYLEAKYEDSLKYFQRVLQEFPNSSSSRDALTSMAATHNRLHRRDEAIETYRRLAERFPDPQNPERASLNIIDILHEAGRYSEALDWVRQTRVQFRDRIGEALALFAQLRIHLAQGSWQAVIADAEELQKMPDLGGTRVPGGTSKAEVTFLQALALEELGKGDEAISLYLSLPDGRNEYYGARATQRLVALAASPKTRTLIEGRFNGARAEARRAFAAAQNEQARNSAQVGLRLTGNVAAIAELRQLLGKTYDLLPSYKFPRFFLTPLGRQTVLSANAESGRQELSNQLIADELFFLGLYDEAVPEFTAARPVKQAAGPLEKAPEVTKQTAGTPTGFTDIDYSVAVYSLRGGLANRAVRFAEQVWRTVPADYVIDLAPVALVELLYPAPYQQSLLKHATSRNVDARLVLSIARQESRFQIDAKSIAAARGMMQFIPATANDIASQLGRTALNNDDLYNPDTAILFGAEYLSNLFKRFPAQPHAVAAAYNGGPDNTARWIARSRSTEADRYVPEIGFSQTRDYVYKVMRNFWIYEQLYDAQLQRKVTADSSPSTSNR